MKKNMPKKELKPEKFTSKHAKEVFEHLEKNPLPEISSYVIDELLSGIHQSCKK